jgi:DNA-binding response OmpR family regulator
MNSETPERRRSLPDPLPPTSPAYLSAEDLLEQVWDEHADPFTNAVAVTISRLRRKRDDPPVTGTVPRVGYRIMADPVRQQETAAS